MNKGKKSVCFAVLIGCLIAGYGWAHLRVDAYRENVNYKLHASAVPVPMEMIRALSGEFKGLAADYLLLEAASFIGSRQSFSAGSEDWDALARLMMQSNALDPYFRSTYMLAHGVLSWRGGKYKETVTILERSKDHLPWDYLPGFLLGFNYFYFLKDNLTASRVLMETSEIPGAPVELATLASRLAAEAGQIDIAITFLTAVREKTEDEEAKERIAIRIQALQGLKVLENAIKRFQSQFARMPHDLQELVTDSILPALPENPYHRPYTFNEGKVNF